MKNLALIAALLVVTPALAGQKPTSSGGVIREYAQNVSQDDWTLGLGWMWDHGTLTHFGGGSTDVAKSANMPALTPGKTYRINVIFSGRTSGTVTISLGQDSHPGYGRDGSYTLHATGSSADAPLTFTPTNDYDGSIIKISVVELGDEEVRMVRAAGGLELLLRLRGHHR